MPKVAYISSTYQDLKKHREAVYKALRKIRYDVIAMEDYVATDERNVEKCCAHSSSSDIYIGIFARRYGHIPEKKNPRGLSITEMEYRAARDSARTKVRTFLLEDNARRPDAAQESEASQKKLQALRAEIAEISYGPFRTVADLVEQVMASVYTAEAETRVGVGLDRVSSLNQIPLEYSGVNVIVDGIQKAIQETVDKHAGAPVLQINLGTNGGWWSTRLLLVAALLEDYTPIQQIVFLNTEPMELDARYLGMCSPADVRRALATHFRDVDKAYREGVPDRVFDAAAEIPSIVGNFATRVGALKPEGEKAVKQPVTKEAVRQWRGFQPESIELANRKVDGALLDEIIAKRSPYVALVRNGKLHELIDRAELATNLALRRH
jgi:Domain of unknown function (DUF4062)